MRPHSVSHATGRPRLVPQSDAEASQHIQSVGEASPCTRCNGEASQRTTDDGEASCRRLTEGCELCPRMPRVLKISDTELQKEVLTFCPLPPIGANAEEFLPTTECQ